ncbi:PHD finger protein 7-like isoform X1 [Limulus polyphemus]|uniref:PHD finger protein 7-like isoform X1 n=2 Tax=Limulus polyphemus TaxID=6850 RepID=A0ABM1BBP2_LIMPO|nr:PHD finger protein 7-like isoform X1 [Limulus polyphemus]
MTSNSNKKQKIAHCIPKRAVCILCETNYEEELMVGKFFHHDEFSIHHFCMLLASGLEQKGQTDEDGIVGFLPEDIWIEVKRGRRLRCFFCKKTGATVGCCNKNCRKVFHVPCAYGRGVLHQFFDNFSSFCADHKPKQNISKKSSILYSCPICLYSVNNQDVDNVILSPCCKNSLFHRQCIQMQALCAGYFFRCPICNNKEDFQNEMLTYGIYIPEQ